MSLRVGVVIFPGSNCDHDALQSGPLMGFETVPLWHKDHDLKNVDLVFLPGGFSYGDYLRCGAIASKSPIMREVIQFAEEGGPILGVCNGFQILTETGLLPGALLRNAHLQFVCKEVYLRVETDDSLFTCAMQRGQVVSSHVAHGDGNYFCDADTLAKLKDEDRVAFRYVTRSGQETAGANPNGSLDDIAGILSENRRILGMMPHPERCLDTALSNTGGRGLFQSMISILAGA